MERFVRVRGAFVKLDLPDPAENWPEMLASVGIVVFLGVLFLAGLMVM